MVFGIERRKKQVSDEISYFIYPLIYQVPGLGSGNGAGATFVNLVGDGSTLSLLKIKGEMRLIALLLLIFLYSLSISLYLLHMQTVKREGLLFMTEDLIPQKIQNSL